jgi:hypothetical protein
MTNKRALCRTLRTALMTGVIGWIAVSAAAAAD